MNNKIKIALNYINKYDYIKNSNIEFPLPISETELFDALDYLVDKQIVKFEIKTEWENGFKHSNEYYFSTFQSKNYYKLKFKNLFFNFIKHIFLSVICPLAVAYFTARITINNNNCCDKSNQNRDYQSENKIH